MALLGNALAILATLGLPRRRNIRWFMSLLAIAIAVIIVHRLPSRIQLTL